MTQFFDRPTVKQASITALVFLVGLAFGNGWATHQALAGQAQWLHDWCGQQVKATVVKRRAEDVATFGFTPEDLQSSKK